MIINKAMVVMKMTYIAIFVSSLLFAIAKIFRCKQTYYDYVGSDYPADK